MRRSAFTLIEVLAVLVILAAIAAIVFPVFARVREQGRRTVCISNLHQIGVALKMYRDDWDGQEARYGVRLSHSDLGLPYTGSPAVGDPLDPYIKNEEVWFCPSDPHDRRGWQSFYYCAYLSSEKTNPSRDWEAFAALRGPDYPVCICLSHVWPHHLSDLRPDYGRHLRHSREFDIIHVLRIDGRVTVRKLGLDEIRYDMERL